MVHLQPFNIKVIQVYAATSNAEEAEVDYEDLQDLLEIKFKKDVLFIIPLPPLSWSFLLSQKMLLGMGVW